MNIKELQEIRRQIKWDNDSLRLLGIGEAYGHASEENRKLMHSRVLKEEDLDQEEGELYFSIFKKSLGGTLGKNLLELGFEKPQDGNHPFQEKLYALKNASELNEADFEQLAGEILDKGNYKNSVCIVCGLFEYSVQAQNKNKEALEDFSSYRFVIVAVSQASLTEIGLYYDPQENKVQRKVNSDMEIQAAPMDAFLYPEFSERKSDVSHILYHSKNQNSINQDFIESLLQIPFQASASDQTKGFQDMVSLMFEERLTPEMAIGLHTNLAEMLEENEEEGMLMLEKGQVRNLLLNSGADRESMSHFDSAYTSALEDQAVAAVNLMEKGKVTIKSDNISLTVKDDALERIQTKVVDGKTYLMVEVDGSMDLSGLNVTIPSDQDNNSNA